LKHRLGAEGRRQASSQGGEGFEPADSLATVISPEVGSNGVPKTAPTP
jgi:hypothetical protein